MASVAKIESGLVAEWPVNLRASFPQTSWPVELTQDMLPEGYYLVQPTEKPEALPGKRVMPAKPVYDEGIVSQQWQQVDAPLVPLTRRQLRLGLLANGISSSAVDTIINAIDGAIEREMAQIEWADATSYERAHPLVEQIADALGLSTGDVDAMWREAMTL